MRRLLVCLGGVFLMSSLASAVLIDNNPAPWRSSPVGVAPTTFQAWEFSTADSAPAVLSVDANPFGTPRADIVGVDPPPFPDTYWMVNDNGHQGVWRIFGNDYLLLQIPNSPVPTPYKEVWIQIVYSAGSIERKPIIQTSPGYAFGTLEVVNSQAIDSLYYYDTFKLRIEPSPDQEWIAIKPRDCTVYIDQIIVETIAIPEPATIGLLSFGLLLLKKKR